MDRRTAGYVMYIDVSVSLVDSILVSPSVQTGESMAFYSCVILFPLIVLITGVIASTLDSPTIRFVPFMSTRLQIFSCPSVLLRVLAEPLPVANPLAVPMMWSNAMPAAQVDNLTPAYSHYRGEHSPNGTVVICGLSSNCHSRFLAQLLTYL
ncbi:hypothetical protein GJ744_010189 [Endocarpon pusillum]|uniref:Uncharacterized protein n=1 Tax=Endocarpon pusillum TaxID=364733 RepID=A0A8H7AIF0_9EURO|nr:hypothetical protein GJ744_010189 [Endocarpon pusillum]